MTWVFWCNVPLSGFWKALFCLTIFPVFVVLLVTSAVVNLFLAEWYAPPFWLELRHAADDYGQEIIVLFASLPLPVALSFVWYKLISWFGTSTREEGADGYSVKIR